MLKVTARAARIRKLILGVDSPLVCLHTFSKKACYHRGHGKGPHAMSDAMDSKKISRRGIVAGIATFGLYGLARDARAAETRPLAERLAAYAAALRYEDLDV